MKTFKEFINEEQFLAEMSLVLDNIKPNLAIWVENPTGYNNQYFKLYNSYSNVKADKVARISLLNAKYLNHRNEDGKENWILNNKEKKELIKILKDESEYENNITNWELTILTYNRDNFHISMGKYVTNNMSKEEYENIVSKTKGALSLNLPMPDYMRL